MQSPITNHQLLLAPSSFLLIKITTFIELYWKTFQQDYTPNTLDQFPLVALYALLNADFIIFERNNRITCLQIKIMILLADSGSTKTSWCLVNTADNTSKNCQTSGINPLYQDEESISQMLRDEFSMAVPKDSTIFFYGAGCINQSVNETVKHALSNFFKPVISFVDTDLLAVARALCQDSPGIACIMGTGSNSCYYDGKEIVNQVSPLGYVLGDEGSGAVIGRKFIADLLKNQLPQPIGNKFFNQYALYPHQIIEQVYKKPFPNRFLAQFTKFICDNLDEPCLRQLVKNSFDEFFARNISQYPQAQHMPIHFIGNIALNFEALLRMSADDSGFHVGIIKESPMEGLIRFHQHQ
jgi:glucosamine kinase